MSVMKFAIGAVSLSAIAVVSWWAMPKVPDSIPVALFFLVGAGVLVHANRGRKRSAK